MTVVPSFFLTGLFTCIVFIISTFVPAILLRWLGKQYPLLKVNNPFRAIYITAIIALAVRTLIAAPQIAIASNVQGIQILVPPYLICFFIVGFIVFSKQVEWEHYGQKEAISSAGISLGCVLWYLLVELAVYTYIS